MPKSLLERQVSLLHHLTDAGAIFGTGGRAIAPALAGIDPGLMRLEARFSHDKRMDKIAAVFPRTFELLGAERDGIIRAFTEARPPVAIERIVNARQFNEFLAERWRCAPPRPAFLPDVAACELALAQARTDAAGAGDPEDDGGTSAMRRHPGAVLLRCQYDVRPLFEPEAAGHVIVARATLLAAARRPGAADPEMLELPPALFELLAALDGWTALEDFADAPDVEALAAELLAAGLIEVRR
jgi:hypothetical protein